jgi:hypothetical protein
MSLDCNVGGADKTLRIIIGIALVAFVVLAQVDTLWKVIAGVAAAIALVTAFVGFCPLNRLIGVDTCKKRV